MIRVSEMDGGMPRFEVAATGSASDIALSPDGRLLAARDFTTVLV